MLGYLRLLVNSRDELALARILDVPRRGLDHHAFTDVKHEARRRGLSMYQVHYHHHHHQSKYLEWPKEKVHFKDHYKSGKNNSQTAL